MFTVLQIYVSIYVCMCMCVPAFLLCVYVLLVCPTVLVDVGLPALSFMPHTHQSCFESYKPNFKSLHPTGVLYNTI